MTVGLTSQWDAPDYYDITVNSDVFPIGKIVDLIHETVKLKAKESGAGETERKIADLSLARKIVATILYAEKIPVRFLGVFSENGNVTLAGSVNTSGLVHRAEAVTVRLPGVQKVQNDIQVLPEYTGTIM